MTIFVFICQTDYPGGQQYGVTSPFSIPWIYDQFLSYSGKFSWRKKMDNRFTGKGTQNVVCF
jgi:hypothetical protein